MTPRPPHKIILLYCANERERSILRCVLDTKGYRVVGGISAEAPVPDMALVIDDSTLETMIAAQSIARLLPFVPMLVVPNPKRSSLPEDDYPSTAQFVPSQTIDLVERLRWAVMRKRGPKPRAINLNAPQTEGATA